MFGNAILLLLENDLKGNKVENHKEKCKINVKDEEKGIVHLK